MRVIKRMERDRWRKSDRNSFRGKNESDERGCGEIDRAVAIERYKQKETVIEIARHREKKSDSDREREKTVLFVLFFPQ